MLGLMNLELDMLNWVQSLTGSRIFDGFWIFLSRIGDYGFVWIVSTAILLAFPKTRKIGAMCSVSLLLGLVFTNILLKNMVARPRPFTYTDIQLLIDAPKSGSFPSGHTTSSFAFAFLLLKERFRIKGFNLYVPALVLATLIAFSRLYLYVHFPTDILAGVAVGYLCSATSIRVIAKASSEKHG